MQQNSSKRSCWLSWSSGKDSAWSLFQLQKQADLNITGIFTSFNEEAERVCMHAVRHSLVEAQAEALNLPLHMINLPQDVSHDTYVERMQNFIQHAESQKVNTMAFGDLYLEDVRSYRIESLKDATIKPVFPLWQKPTQALAQEMIDGGLKAIITCVDTAQLSEKFLGREFNLKLLQEFPEDVDPCGENGEFHTFVYDGPMFNTPISVQTGEKHISGQFHFIDLVATQP